MDQEQVKPPGEQLRPIQFGICYDNLTREVFADIVKIYFDLAGGNEARYLKEDQRRYEQRVNELYGSMQRELDPNDRYTRGEHYGMRVGSSLDDNSKLEFVFMSNDRVNQQLPDDVRIFRMNFYPNGPEGTPREAEATHMSNEINQAIASYLKDNNLAVPLK